MKKRIVSFLLVLVICMSLLSVTAFAAKLDDLIGKADGVMTTLGAFRDVFGLPPQIASLFETLKLDKLSGLFSAITILLGKFL